MPTHLVISLSYPSSQCWAVNESTRIDLQDGFPDYDLVRRNASVDEGLHWNAITSREKITVGFGCPKILDIIKVNEAANFSVNCHVASLIETFLHEVGIISCVDNGVVRQFFSEFLHERNKPSLASAVDEGVQITPVNINTVKLVL